MQFGICFSPTRGREICPKAAQGPRLVFILIAEWFPATRASERASTRAPWHSGGPRKPAWEPLGTELWAHPSVHCCERFPFALSLPFPVNDHSTRQCSPAGPHSHSQPALQGWWDSLFQEWLKESEFSILPNWGELSSTVKVTSIEKKVPFPPFLFERTPKDTQSCSPALEGNLLPCWIAPGTVNSGLGCAAKPLAFSVAELMWPWLRIMGPQMLRKWTSFQLTVDS